MAIMRTSYANPWRDLDTLTNRLSRMFEDFPTPTESGNWVPAVDVTETAGELLLTAELPGLSRDDVELEVENNVLTIRGEKAEVRREGDDSPKYHLWERRYGVFQRSFTLPRTVKPEAIEAEFENGVLQVRLPKAPEAQTRRIGIKAVEK